MYHPNDPPPPPPLPFPLRTEIFSFSYFLKGPLLPGRPLFFFFFEGGGTLLSGFNRSGKINITFGEPLFSKEPLLSKFYGILFTKDNFNKANIRQFLANLPCGILISPVTRAVANMNQTEVINHFVASSCCCCSSFEGGWKTLFINT